MVKEQITINKVTYVFVSEKDGSYFLGDNNYINYYQRKDNEEKFREIWRAMKIE